MTTTLRQFKKKALKNKAVKAEYDALTPEYAIIRSIISERQKMGLSQTELAQRVGTKQPVISRLESGAGNPTLDLLRRVAKALNTELHVSLQ
jgi:ribosome-binding protein aMBF1 (putative translation factor)